MKGDFSRYFSASRIARWPLWKSIVALVLALALLGGGTGSAFAAFVAASTSTAAEPVATATPQPTPSQLDAGWVNLAWYASGMTSMDSMKAQYTISMELNATQQSIGVDVYATTVDTQKKAPFTGVAVTVTLTCLSLTQIQDTSNQYDTAASKEGAVTQYALDTGTGSALIPKLNPGTYQVALTCADSTYAMPSAQKITVKEKAVYKKTDTKAKTQTTATKQEDTAPVAENSAAGEGAAVTVTSGSSGEGYVLTSDYFWTDAATGKRYLYNSDHTKSAYAIDTISATRQSDGVKVEVIRKAVWDAAMQAVLDAAAKAAASNTATVAPTRARLAGGTVSPLLAAQGGLTLMQLTSAAGGDPTPTEVPAATETPAPATPTPEPAATATPTPEPAATATPSPSASASPSPSPSASASATPSPSASASPTPTPSATPTPAASVDLYNTASNSYIGSTLFLLPAATKIFVGTGTTAGGQVMGIDVSYYQGSIDWNAVKAAGIDFVIIRVGYRGYKSGTIVLDPQFYNYMKGAKAAGLRVGVYFFSQAVNEQEAVEEASACLNAIAGYGMNYPVYIDCETSGGRGSGRADGLSMADRTAVAAAFCETVKNSGYSAGVYASKSWFGSHLSYSTLSQYSIWNAQWSSASSITCSLWQYTNNGTVPGISGRVDLDISYMG